MTDRIRLEDYGYPGDALIADRSAHGVDITCNANASIGPEAFVDEREAVISLTAIQARELAEWILAVVK